MKTVNAAVSNSIRNDYAVYAQPKLTAEWNMNRYFETKVDNDPAEDLFGYDIELFPIESIVEPVRPTKGILKARTDEALVTDLSATATSRYYTASDEDVYHYWTSPFITDESKTFVTGTYPTGSVHPHVMYKQPVLINKIVVKVENFWATPDLFYVKVASTFSGVVGTDGFYPYTFSDYVVVATSPTIDNKGQISLWWNGTSWSSTKPTDLTNPPLTSVSGIMVDVRTMKEGRDLNGNISQSASRAYVSNVWTVPKPTTNLTGINSSFNLIEISARREVDLSNYLISVDDEFDVSESSDLYPIGTLTTNDGNVTLSNIYTPSGGGAQLSGYFNNDNSASPYYGIIHPNVQFNLEYIYTVSGTQYSVQEFKLYGDEWTGQKNEEITISLHDSSIFLEEITPPPALYENMTVPQLFQRILDSCGFVDWVLDSDDRNITTTIPMFWMNMDKNCWEVLDDLAKGTQTAIYFDSFGKLQIKTRYAAYNNTRTTTWTMQGETISGVPADIIDYAEDGEVGSNYFTISYQTTQWDNWNNGTPSMQKVWEPDGDIVLNSAPLLVNMNTTDNVFWISSSQAAYWPYEGMVQIEGELIKYRGKNYLYYTAGPTLNQTWVGSSDEYAAILALTPDQYKPFNYFSGAMLVETDPKDGLLRGYWNSETLAHKVDLANYSTKRAVYNTSGVATVTTNTAGLYHDSNLSLAELRPVNGDKGLDMTMATIGASTDSGWQYLGTKLEFQQWPGFIDQQAGIALNLSGSLDGYYVDIRANALATPHKGLCVYSVKSGVMTILAQIPCLVAENVFYELDISLFLSGTDHILNVSVDGRRYVSVFIPHTASYYNSKNGKMGMFSRGVSAPNYEYLYGVARDEPDPGDDATFWNLIHGGFTGAQWDREWVHGWKSRKIRKKKKWTKELGRWNNYFFDEFGPYVHEVREFDVKFDPAPAQISRLYSTNDWYSICTQYNSSPFGATFTLANTARVGAIVNGDDEYTYPGQSINQVLNVIGRVLVFADAETIIVQNNDSIKVRGKIESELSSTWIQNKAMAQDIADWMDAHWSQGLDEITVTIFGNPLIELTDVVAINYPTKNMTPTNNKYFVTSIKNSFDTGLTTQLTLRRVV